MSNEEKILKLMKAHTIGVVDMRDAVVMQINLMHGLTTEQKKQITETLDNLVVLPTRIIKEFPNG